jgi:Zn-dependent peptidase ImmA (M78 family)
MTVTEELVHIRLHRPLIEAIQGPDDFRKLHSHPQWTEIERNAKKFAAMLLMPTQPLMVGAREVYHQIAGQPQIREQLLPRQESFASLHILTRRASEGSEALPSLARRVRMSFFGARVI